MKRVLLVLLPLLASGCAQKFVHPSKGETDFERDKQDCQVKAGQAGLRSGWRLEFIEKCLKLEGWKEARL